ncbi:Ribosomal protein L7Ae/L30e/S12e/Gadd45 [Syntrophomonas zehnderi OL-4]|uniref:Ribosomal protein L7Ae/L30e/S12e/Gadd45 n=1 Tax=Syntrophomonas zehnderi OL-4 TaxID=690567 RepID=A0A0E4C8A8_9FIRM|nr:ribosomal L7Ae/L30e/S12e/Gadd45 family protein [Syntrophomonas zehnderi]CFX37131.1 Ribosomal protein L7Ae/L30e/S12e/Gadd45 [Syntrophomonas zehnderi OL-4]
MSLNEIREGNKVIGSKQVKKAITKGLAKKVYLADDAEPHIIGPLQELCRQYQVEIEEVNKMEQLGNACGIEVGSAAVALLID